MDPIATCAERTLRRSAHPALKLSELVDCLAELLDRSLDAGRLRAILETHPDRFRILEPRSASGRSPTGTAMVREIVRDAWVVAISEPDGPPDGAHPAAATLRESVRWLARSIDTRSRVEVGRWAALAVAERSARERLERAA